VKRCAMTRIQIALQFCVINDGKKKDSNDKNKQVLVKALHIEINQVHQTTVRSCIKHLFLSVFPLGIKMHLVCNYCILTNAQAKAKADCL